ncbi:hypothetical protein BABINDRAFT_6498 [Babjeviella inositovora NRRL Y-12698]|uniref:Swi5-domain-containing protein n=1 Tax=Babjeviella inositovora NRRL Y-12698 TaxID=984486 RepID=A0A1E3QW15_9ASCO|nr:uncharacterized protein BABINDRAFT_6498 [Babjeviella inositovora NRRL Y-12698]ODQ81859.1 hypothetical protein BABINDRAFT_6498 [Babjeviella inositovora NRRL Y-12698]
MYRSQFKSLPFSTPEASKKRIAEKEVKLAQLKLQFEQLLEQYKSSESPETVVKRHVTDLNRYNGVRDAALAMVTMIAEQRSLRIADVLTEMGVEPNEE